MGEGGIWWIRNPCAIKGLNVEEEQSSYRVVDENVIIMAFPLFLINGNAVCNW